MSRMLLLSVLLVGCSKEIVFLDNVGEEVRGTPQFLDVGRAPSQDVVHSSYVLGAEFRMALWARSGHNRVERWSLESSDASMLSVGARTDSSDPEYAEWSLHAGGVGEVKLTAIDAGGNERDSIVFEIVAPDEMRVVPTGASRIGRSDLHFEEAYVLDSASVSAEYYANGERLWGGTGLIFTEDLEEQGDSLSLSGVAFPIHHDSVSRDDYEIDDIPSGTVAAGRMVSMYGVQGTSAGYAVSAPLMLTSAGAEDVANWQLLTSDETGAREREVLGVYPYGTAADGLPVVGMRVSWSAEDLQVSGDPEGWTDYLEYTYREGQELEVEGVFHEVGQRVVVHGENPRAVTSSAACQTGATPGMFGALGALVTLLMRRRR